METSAVPRHRLLEEFGNRERLFFYNEICIIIVWCCMQKWRKNWSARRVCWEDVGDER